MAHCFSHDAIASFFSASFKVEYYENLSEIYSLLGPWDDDGSHFKTLPCKHSEREEAVDIASHQYLFAKERRTSKSTCSTGVACKRTWKKSKESPIFPNTAGSSEESATATPLLTKIGR